MHNGILEKLQRLEKYNDSPAPILSIYFSPSQPQIEHTLLAKELESLIHTALHPKQKKEIRNNINYIRGFMLKYDLDPEEKTTAIFSGGNSFFEVIRLPYAIKNCVELSHSPYIDPVLKVSEGERRFLVILVDRRKGLFFTMVDNTLEEYGAIVDDTVPQNVKGRWPEVQHAQRDDKIQRHILDHLHQHFSLICDEINNFVGEKQIYGVIIGGHKNEFSQFKRCLPRSLKEKIVGEFVSELNINFNQIQKKAKEIITKCNRSYSSHMYQHQM